MKQKTVYILIIICCIGLFSSAGSNGKEGDRKSCCRFGNNACAKATPLKTIKEADVDLPPLRLLMFDL